MASVLTFAYLRELQKKERTSRKLENLPADFYNTISEYLARKGIHKDVESAQPIIKYILERREQKVLELAAMSVSADIAPENLLPEEKELFDAAQSLLKAHRDVIGNIFEKKSKQNHETSMRPHPKGGGLIGSVSSHLTPHPLRSKLSSTAQNSPIGNSALKNGVSTIVDEDPEDKTPAKKDHSEGEEKEHSEEKPATVQLKVLKDVPSFIAEDLAAHGPWKQGDVVECPPKAAKVLVDNGFAKVS